MLGKPSQSSASLEDRCHVRHPLSRIEVFSSLIFTLVMASSRCGNQVPNIMLADQYECCPDVTQFWISEKDGVRARWNATHLVSRGGNIFAAPEWFIQDFPSTPLDGELWTGRGRYAEVSSISENKIPMTDGDPSASWYLTCPITRAISTNESRP